jgi:hypothetical protein
MKISINEDGYGKSPDNPVLLNSINSNLRFLENLVTAEHGYHLLAHRAGSIPHNKRILDAYEIYTSNGVIDCLYFSIYEEKNLLLPPRGYLFEFPFPDDESVDAKNYFQDKEEEVSIAKIPMLERHLLFSRAINFRLPNFPEDYIRQLYEQGDLIGVKDLDLLVKSIPTNS